MKVWNFFCQKTFYFLNIWILFFKGSFAPHTPRRCCAPGPNILLDWGPKPHWLASTTYFAKISSRFFASHQFPVNHCWIHNRPYLRKLNFTQKKPEHKNPFQNIAHHLRQHPILLYLVSKNNRKLWTKTIITQKIKFAKLIFHSFQNSTRQFGQKNGNRYFWERGEVVSHILS